MTRRRWIADEISGDTAALVGEHAAHLSRVLRAQVGQEFDIATGNVVRLGRVTSIADDRVVFALGEEQAIKAAAPIDLVLAIFKFDRMEWAIEKCTEIGVSTVHPVIAQRTDAHLAAAAAKRCERWRRIVLQASEQARRAVTPDIADPVKLKDLRNDVANSHLRSGSMRIVLAENEAGTLLREALRDVTAGATLAIGPEGGWAPEELEWFQKFGWTSASLGDTILRAETAAIVATALAVSALQ